MHYGADELTMRCLRALEQDHRSPPTQVVLVENGPGTAFAQRVRSELPEVLVVGAGVNLGFAAGCNLGLTALRHVDLIALVNSDVRVTSGWLLPLAAALEREPALGAASPKILFDGAFHTLHIQASDSTRPGWGDRRSVAWRLRRVWLGSEDVTGRCQLVSGFWEPDGVGSWAGPLVELRVPAGTSGALRIDMDVPVSGQTLVVQPGGQVVQPPAMSSTIQELVLPGEAQRVINNVGSEWRSDGYGVDRGFQEIDAGQHDRPQDVPAWCGGAVLLRRSYLDESEGFDERLFLYYEDLELAIRGAALGWRYRLEPASVVEHRHAASFATDPAGITARRERNRLLVLLRHGRRRQVVAALVSFTLVTGSYLRRDVIAPVVRGRRPVWAIVASRVSALTGAILLAPAMIRSRRRDRRVQREHHTWPDC